MTSKNIARIVALVLVGTAFVWMLGRLDWQELGHRLAGASLGRFGLMLVVWLAVLLLRPLRLRYLITVFGRPRGAHYGTIWAAMMLAATVNSFAPMRAGDALMAVFLRQRMGLGVHQSISVIIADLACDFICVATAFLGALAFAPAIAAWTDQVVIVLIVVLTLGAVVGSVVLRYRVAVLALLERTLSRTAPRWRARGIEMASELLDSLAAIGTWKVAVPLILLSAVIWGLTGLSYWLGLSAVFGDPPIAGAVFNMAAVALSFAVPVGPGGMGAFEASSVVALAVFDVPVEAALPFAVVAHAAQLSSVLLFTALSMLTRRADLSLLQKDDGRH